MAILHELRHEAEEQGQQERRDVLAVHVGIGHKHNLVITQLGDIELFVDTSTQSGNDGLDFGVLEHLIHAGLLHIKNLASQRKDRLEHRVTAAFSGTACRVTLHDVQLGELGILGAAIRQLARKTTQITSGLAANQLTGFARSYASMRRGDGLVDNDLGLSRVGIEPVIKVLIDCALDKALDFRVTELGLGLAFELRIAHLDGNNSSKALTAIITGEVAILFLEKLVLLGVAIHQGGQRRTEAFLVGTTFMGIDGVGESVDGLLVALVPLQCDFNLVVLTFDVETNDGGVNGRLVAVEELNVVLQAIRVVVDDFLLFLGSLRLAIFPSSVLLIEGAQAHSLIAGLSNLIELRLLLRDSTLITKNNGQSLVEEGHFLQAARNSVVIKLDGFKNLRIRPETDGSTGTTGVLTLDELIRDGVGEVLVPVLAIALNVRLNAGGQGIDHGNTHTVETTGNGVRLRVELTARMQLSHDDLDGRNARGVHFHWDTTAVIDDLDATILEESDGDLVGVARHCLIDGVVNNLPDQVVQTTGTGGTDVHAGTLADGLEAFQNRN